MVTLRIRARLEKVIVAQLLRKFHRIFWISTASPLVPILNQMYPRFAFKLSFNIIFQPTLRFFKNIDNTFDIIDNRRKAVSMQVVSRRRLKCKTHWRKYLYVGTSIELRNTRRQVEKRKYNMATARIFW